MNGLHGHVGPAEQIGEGRPGLARRRRRRGHGCAGRRRSRSRRLRRVVLECGHGMIGPGDAYMPGVNRSAAWEQVRTRWGPTEAVRKARSAVGVRSEEHTSEL